MGLGRCSFQKGVIQSRKSIAEHEGMKTFSKLAHMVDALSKNISAKAFSRMHLPIRIISKEIVLLQKCPLKRRRLFLDDFPKKHL